MGQRAFSTFIIGLGFTGSAIALLVALTPERELASTSLLQLTVCFGFAAIVIGAGVAAGGGVLLAIGLILALSCFLYAWIALRKVGRERSRQNLAPVTAETAPMSDTQSPVQRKPLPSIVTRYFGPAPPRDAPELQRLQWIRALGLKLSLPFLPVIALMLLEIDQTWLYAFGGIYLIGWSISLAKLSWTIRQLRRAARP